METEITDVASLRALLGESHPATKNKIWQKLNERHIDFIENCPFFIFGTAADNGYPQTSPKGDNPGFIRVVNETTLHIPERPGNKLLFSLENILNSSGKVSMILILPNTRETLRIEGHCRILSDPALCAQFSVDNKAALLVLEISIDQLFFHCGKSLIRSKLWKSENWPQPRKISFGKEFSENTEEKRNLILQGKDKLLQVAIDQGIEGNYKSDLW
ncbi:MAG: PPOX class probable FMN-dependent enzyme [Paraglaciecola psychrophila]|jgi:PPOX class probable FMN-dependent enzyme